VLAALIRLFYFSVVLGIGSVAVTTVSPAFSRVPRLQK